MGNGYYIFNGTIVNTSSEINRVPYPVFRKNNNTITLISPDGSTSIWYYNEASKELVHDKTNNGAVIYDLVHKLGTGTAGATMHNVEVTKEMILGKVLPMQ